MRKQWLLMSVVAGLFVLSHVLVSAEPKEKPRNKKKAIEVVNLNILHGFACDPPFPVGCPEHEREPDRPRWPRRGGRSRESSRCIARRTS
jgi:hypothetical protein